MTSIFFRWPMRSLAIGSGFAAYALGAAAWILLPPYIISWEEMNWNYSDWVKIAGFLACFPGGVSILRIYVRHVALIKVLASYLLPLPAVVIVVLVMKMRQPDVVELSCIFLPAAFVIFFLLKQLDRPAAHGRITA